MAEIPVWGFTVKRVPEPPRGYNQGSQAPPPELLKSATTEIVNSNNMEFQVWYMGLMVKALTSGSQGSAILDQFNDAMRNDLLNLGSDPWPEIIRFAGSKPPYNTVELQAIAEWEQIYQINQQAGDQEQGLQITKGVTTTKTQQTHFDATIGASATAGWGPVSATINSSFSAGHSWETSVALSEETTKTSTYHFESDHYYQVWQLKIKITAGDAHSMSKIPIIQMLSYPHGATKSLTPKQMLNMLPEEFPLKAQLKEQLESGEIKIPVQV